MNLLVPCTTRPPRPQEVSGKDYVFVSDDFILTDPSIIEYREYKTIRGVWYYATINNLIEGDNVIVACPQQYLNIKRFYEHDDSVKVIPIYIYIDDGIRLQRLISREMLADNPNYYEICRRYEADMKDFACMEGERKYLNYSLSECVAEILRIIKGE